MVYSNKRKPQETHREFSRIAIWTRPRQSVDIQEAFNVYQDRIYKLDVCSYNFHIFRFSRSDKEKVDVYCFMSKFNRRSSDHDVLFLPRSLVTPRHRCVIVHEVDTHRDRLLVTHYELTYLRNKGSRKS